MIYDNSFLTNEAIRLLKAWIGIPAPGGEEGAAADLVQHYLETEGMNTGRAGNNVWCLSPNFDLKRPTLLLTAHLDKPKAAGGWRRGPLTAWEANGKIYGLGSNRTGASLACLLQVFGHLCRTRQTYNTVFLASAEGETFGDEGMPRALKELPPPAFALVGGPTEMRPVTEEKGWMTVQAQCTGKSGPALRGGGDNAIYQALQDLNWVKTYAFERVSESLGPVTMQVTRIEGGDHPESVPAQCRFCLDIRPNGHYTCAEITTLLEQHLKARITEVKPCLEAVVTDNRHPLVERAVRAGKMPAGSPYVSERARIGCPSMKMGPGKPARSGGPDEFILASELEEAIGIYLQVLDGATL